MADPFDAPAVPPGWKKTADGMLIKEGQQMEEGDPEDSLCNICCVEPSDVYFVPCCHQSCAQCVQKLRIANIYKVGRPSASCLGRLCQYLVVHEHFRFSRSMFQENVATVAGYFERWTIKTNSPIFLGFVGNGAQ